jgi:mycofactocin precursor
MADETTAVADPDESAIAEDVLAEDVLVEDVLVEEVSIDGMCGVY